ncbi:restriction endonuclease [Flavobacterium sp. MMLR14_040]|uniref:McrC family protein n=1 Tax=Flavobacterium sp. MMLR14_040 TaxID=3093843 RepID=UPI00298FAABB|nr:restriction endonuclease [Flavobacterium sp. MMLR14_040]MDW8852899.1 restriction endonuclease [Flavobacterium sp. MMLR14_040]
MSKENTIQVFEHGFLPIKGKFEPRHFVALSKLNALHNYQYFDLKYNGVVFKQFVGVIQVDGLTIEILPKIDNDGKSTNVWQKALIEMLRVTKKLKVQKLDNADVNRQNIHLLDIYFEWFLNEVQLLIHQGLIKQYYKETGDVKALKGKLEFAGHISRNLVHKERFFTTHQVYDKDHLVHQIISKALNIVEKCTKGNYLYSKCKTVQLDFPEVKNISVTEATFSKIQKTRKNAPYETALAISKFIILNFAPNISSGSENMLALLFDMNNLWEEYILARLKQSDREVTVYGQQSTHFWNGISIRPDIVIEKDEMKFIIDTKWKNISYSKPSTHDLRQMYVYNDYWKSDKAMLLYPSNTTDFSPFIKFQNHHVHEYMFENDKKLKQHGCCLGKGSIFKLGKDSLNDKIGDEIIDCFLIK